ncbi:IS481 family transposase [Arthrobacter sp. FW306-07-I]|uniref:IS481 family transposase n=1 Tax=Arthrobacter sp. FW306-07-I TaxID=2879622 RepID=UPI001F003ECF|nr:IS481 family transposase [Arthrobacter sp. FW306-07-I]UKA75010.1 IS481 family transposase [Arthrobacter sp. FW306-07-I]UKA76139.1 IS481 family transposase [Arthrobacter sp. FW306-07-I]UKA76267.1 IS481 family transposase [Arthrobacter sp. FW306-07-I]
MSHANAALTPRQRLRVARLIVDHGWPVSRAAEQFNCSWPTAKRWAARYAAMGEAGMAERSSRPYRVANRTPQQLVRKVVHLRWKQRLGPVAIGAKLAMPASTVHAVLVRCRLNRLHHVDKRTGEVIRRYEHETPGAMIHVDVKKLGNIPDGGGWRYVGRQQGKQNRAATPSKPRSKHRNPLIGTAYVHTVIDDHSRVAYAEIHGDETAATAVAVLQRAVSWFAARGVTVERVLSDNGAAYKSHLWRDACRELDIRAKKTRPYRPQTNGKIERFHRTLADGWAFKRFYATESARRNALPAWLHHYNHHRPHTAIGGHPPISRLTNLPGQYT